MLVWLYFFVVLTISLVMFGLFYSISKGEVSVPAWLVEVMISFFWFSVVFKVLKDRYFDPTRPSPAPQILQSMVGCCFLGCVAIAYGLSLGFLPWFTDSVMHRILLAYLGGLAVVVYAPMAVAEFWYPRWARKQESVSARGEEIYALALECPAVKRFTALFPGCRVFVFNNKVKNVEASCLLAFRRERKERPGLWEEISLEVPVDWRARRAAASRIKPDRYIFQTGEEGSAVMHLSEPENWEVHANSTPLDEALLETFDRMVNRYPPMDKLPFRLAIHPVEYEEILISRSVSSPMDSKQGYPRPVSGSVMDI